MTLFAEGSALAGAVFVSLYRSVWKPSKLLDYVIGTYNDAVSLKATREACITLLINWIEARLVPDFFRSRRSKKSKKKTLARLIEFADSLERRSHLLREFSSCYALKLAIWRTWCYRRRLGHVNIGPQQRLEAAVEGTGGESTSEADKKAAAKEQKRSFLVFIWVPDPRNVALRFTMQELVMFRRVTCTGSLH